jgi:AraC family transcriptional activator FtrA
MRMFGAHVPAPADPADAEVAALAVDGEDAAKADEHLLAMSGAVHAEHGIIILTGSGSDEWQNSAYPNDFCHHGDMAQGQRSGPTKREPEEHLVVGLVGRRAAMFELGVVHEVFGLERGELVDPHYTCRLIGAFGQEIPVTDGDFTLTTPWTFDDIAEADTVVVATWPDYDLPAPPRVLEAIRDLHRRGRRVVSVCTGAFLLAEAGLLDDRPATTHWRHAEELARRYPTVKIDPNVLFVEAAEGIYTSAGTAAGIDLCLHLVRLDHGAAAANMVARRMVVPPQRDGGQAQFVDAPVPACNDGDPMAATLEWAVQHLDEPLQVEDLARRALLSPRTFARRFRDATGTTPLQWLTRQRVLHAQRLLETTDLPVEAVARRCGLGTGTALRTHFRRVVGTSPLAYRRAFLRVDAPDSPEIAPLRPK